MDNTDNTKIISLLDSMDKSLYRITLRMTSLVDILTDFTSEAKTSEKLKQASDDGAPDAALKPFDAILERLDTITENFDKWARSTAKTGGILGSLAGLGMLLIDPNALMNTVGKVLTFLADMMEMVSSAINGDWTKSFNLISDHLLGVGIGLGVIGVLFGTRILKTITAITKTGIFIASAGAKIVSFLPALVGSMGKLPYTFGFITGKLGVIGKAAGSLISKLAFPLTMIMGVAGAIDGAIDGWYEGGTMGAIKGAITGAFDTLVGSIVDLLRDGVASIVGYFGFDQTEEAIRSFNISGMFKNMIDDIFVPIQAAVDWVKAAFTDPTTTLSNLFTSILGGMESFSGLFWKPVDEAIKWIAGVFDWQVGEDFSMNDLIYKSIDSAINWVTDIFSWTKENATNENGEFSIKTLFWNTIDEMRDWFTNLFDFLPDWRDVKQSLIDTLPDFLKDAIAPATDEDRKATQDLADRVNGFEVGGVAQAPKTGGLAMLHGTEAILPLNRTPSATALNAVSTSPSVITRVARNLGNISAVATQAAKNTITAVSAPTVITKGGDTVTNITNISSAGASRYLRPAYEA